MYIYGGENETAQLIIIMKVFAQNLVHRDYSKRINVWQRGDCSTFMCGRKNMADRRSPQNLYVWQREGDCRTYMCGRDRDAVWSPMTIL